MSKETAKAKWADLRQCIDTGGLVRFTHKTCHCELIWPDGRAQILDGRTYQGFLNTTAPVLDRKETGSVYTQDLIIEWTAPLVKIRDLQLQKSKLENQALRAFPSSPRQ